MAEERGGTGPWPQEGTQLGGGTGIAYRVGRLIRQVQSARIHTVTNEFGTPLVLKVFRTEQRQGESATVQWQRERDLLQRVNHPRVLRLRDAFCCDEHPCLVLERADTSLERWIHVRGPLMEQEAVELARQLLQGLDAIHRAGILHLDLSPANVLLHLGKSRRKRPRALIADFGIAVRADEEVHLGRPPRDWANLPPEMLRPGAHRPTHHLDLYGLGLTLLFARRGALPLTNALPPEEVEQQVQGGVFGREAQRLAAPLGPFLARLLQVDPQQRFGSALEAWRALRNPS